MLLYKPRSISYQQPYNLSGGEGGGEGGVRVGARHLLVHLSVGGHCGVRGWSGMGTFRKVLGQLRHSAIALTLRHLTLETHYIHIPFGAGLVIQRLIFRRLVAPRLPYLMPHTRYEFSP